MELLPVSAVAGKKLRVLETPRRRPCIEGPNDATVETTHPHKAITSPDADVTMDSMIHSP